MSVKLETLSFRDWYKTRGIEIEQEHPYCDLEIQYLKFLKKHYVEYYERLMDIKKEDLECKNVPIE